ncbi:MAG TPA: hypothetical protein DCS67_10460, partial [Clostridiales bacterium UBA8960]|nr:hypothetical protein [Clostridiales bacterium UBA8960]
MKTDFDRKAYEAYSYENNQVFIRRSLILASILYLAFGCLDFILFRSIFFRLAAIRYGLFLPFALSLFWLLRSDFFKKRMNIVVSVIILVASVTTSFMQVTTGDLGHSVYFSGQLVIILYLFTGSKLSFKWAFATGALILVLYNLTILMRISDAFELILLIKDNTFLWASFGLGAVTSYGLERYLIKEYLSEMNARNQLMDEINQRKYSEEQLIYFANHDELTGLHNRRYFSEELSVLIERSHEKEDKIIVVLMDIDHFKIINDSLGHEMGDKVLNIITERLRGLHLDHALIARMGGDEFGIFVYGDVDLGALLDQILCVFKEPVQIYPHHFHISSSIGVSLFPDHRFSSEELIRCAETAMYRAKENGKNRIEYFSEAFDISVQKRGLVARKLKNALENKDFYMVYQQKVDAESECIEGFEALIRWEDPEEGFIPPDLFIKIAEETGQISTIGDWVIETSCKEFMSLPHEANTRLKLSVNLSTIELQQPDIAERVDHILKKYGMCPANLCLEITESSVIQSMDCVLEAIARFKKIGVEVSIDDFGTGFSSLAYLSKLDVEELKIDRSFIMKIG